MIMIFLRSMETRFTHGVRRVFEIYRSRMYIASDFHFSDVNVPILLVCSMPRSQGLIYGCDGRK